MSTLITKEYQEMNSNLHSRDPLFGSKAYRQAANVEFSLDLKAGDTLLDYGCGKASLHREFAKRDITVINYDPALKAFEEHPSKREGYPFDYLACLDVLEHVEPDSIKPVLDDIKACFTKKAFLLISTAPSNKKLPDGRNAHLIIQPRGWWLDRLEEHEYTVEKLVDNRKGWLGVLCT